MWGGVCPSLPKACFRLVGNRSFFIRTLFYKWQYPRVLKRPSIEEFVLNDFHISLDRMLSKDCGMTPFF